MMKMPLQVNSYGSADFLDDMNQEVFTRVQECVGVDLFVSGVTVCDICV